MKFDSPTQVCFTYGDDEEIETLYGVAYGDVIICGCCGSLFALDEVTIVEKLPWIDIADAIRGN